MVQAHHAGHGAQADLYAVLDDVFKALLRLRLPFDYEQSKKAMAHSLLCALTVNGLSPYQKDLTTLLV